MGILGIKRGMEVPRAKASSICCPTKPSHRVLETCIDGHSSLAHVHCSRLKCTTVPSENEPLLSAPACAHLCTGAILQALSWRSAVHSLPGFFFVRASFARCSWLNHPCVATSARDGGMNTGEVDGPAL